MTPVELALLAARFVHIAALVQAMGALVFLLVVARVPGADLNARADLDARAGLDRQQAAALLHARRQIRLLAVASLLVALISGAFWLHVQSMAMGGGAWGISLSRLAVVLQTHFGQVFSLRLGLLLLGTIMLLAAWRVLPDVLQALAVLLLGAALLLQPLLGHGAAVEQLWLPFATALHVMAASLWLGALVPLWLMLRCAPFAGALAAQRFSLLGIGCVLTIAITGGLQWPMIGDVPRLIGTPYGLLLGFKTALFGLLLAFAAANRFILTPRALAGEQGAMRGIRLSVFGEAATGLVLIAAAATLASLPPGAHEQPLWPFSVRPVPGLWDDAFLRDRIIRTLTPPALALVLIIAGVWLRRLRWPLLGAAVAALFFIPSFPYKPYVRAAFPTSFQQWERVRSPSSLRHGSEVFADQCSGCHAADARGRGPLATGDPVWPPNLTAPLYRKHLDGELFWSIRNGMSTPEGVESMPAFHEKLDDADIWMLVDFLRARGSAFSMDATGRWNAPTRAPAMDITCRQSGRTIDPSRPGGTMLYIEAGVSTADQQTGGEITVKACGVDNASQRFQWLAALALLAGDAIGEPPVNFERAVVLVDGQGFLRRLWLAPPPDEERLSEAVRASQTPLNVAGVHH